MIFCAGLILLQIIISDSIYVVVNDRISHFYNIYMLYWHHIFFYTYMYTRVCACVSNFCHLLFDGQLWSICWILWAFLQTVWECLFLFDLCLVQWNLRYMYSYERFIFMFSWNSVVFFQNHSTKSHPDHMHSAVTSFVILTATVILFL